MLDGYDDINAKARIDTGSALDRAKAVKIREAFAYANAA